ncbi:HlyD family secretion protein [Shewanella spartinae]|uniref:HlyD family secretion protein n=1 Tax=Shewanella spartinae TaxID=2864205 RepID=UPI001C66050C|nr:HlyD family secretion protein [Shewanella spartinae]QYJ93381.1 HlyD family secretion protein [Shewanella spartinae]
MSKRRIFIVLPLLLLAVVVGGYYWWSQVRFIESTDNAYVEADISNISVKVPGYVVTAKVTDNQHVEQGQLLAELESNQYRAKVSQSQASLQSSQAELQTLSAKVTLQQAIIRQAAAGVASAEAEKIRAEQQLKRTTKLKHRDYSSQDEVDQATAAFDSAVGHLDEAKAALVAKQAELAVLNAQLNQSQSQVAQAKAGLELAEIQLADTQIRAPFSGVIGKRGALTGQYVQPGQSLYSLVPDGAVWITANFKETQIQHMQPGQLVQVHLDAFPDQSFTGVIDSLAPASGAKFSLLPAENATGNFTKIVQRIPVRIRLDLDDQINIVPGLSAVVKVDTRGAPKDTVIASNRKQVSVKATQ